MNYRVLLVCMGNICRSPTAEVVLRVFIKNNNLGGIVEVDSAGTHGYHVGEAPDGRTQRAAAVRGYNLSQVRARKVARQDLDYFDLILAMDKSNLDNLQRMASPEQREKLKLFMEYAKTTMMTRFQTLTMALGTASILYWIWLRMPRKAWLKS